jgi:hypothetical protein
MAQALRRGNERVFLDPALQLPDAKADKQRHHQ